MSATLQMQVSQPQDANAGWQEYAPKSPFRQPLRQQGHDFPAGAKPGEAPGWTAEQESTVEAMQNAEGVATPCFP